MPREIITFQCTECKNRNYIVDQEQEDHHGAPGNEEVLPALPQAPAAQGNQVDIRS